MLKKLISIVLVMLSFVLQAQIQKGNIIFENITTENGLSSNTVNCIYQDSKGFIWIGTNNGLSKYDGVDVITYYKDNTNNSLAGNAVNSIVEDDQHNLWIGTNEGISYFNPLLHIFTNYLNTPTTEQKPNSKIFFVAIDKANAVWVSGNSSLMQFNPELKNFTSYKIDIGQSLPVTRNYNMRSAFEDSKQRLWLPTSYGVKLFNRKSKEVTSFHYPEKDKALVENFVTAVKELPDKKIIATTWSGGILIFNEQLQQFEKMSFYEQPTKDRNFINIVFDVVVVKDKALVSTSEGLVEMMPSNIVPGICTSYTLNKPNITNPYAISSPIVKNSMVDRDGTIWLATKGVSKIDPVRQQFNTQLTQLNGLKINVSSIISLQNKLVVGGTKDAYFISNNTITPFGFTQKIISDYGENVWDVTVGKNNIWLATTNGVIQTTLQGKIVKQYIHQSNNSSTISGQRIWKVFEDSNEMLWVSTVRKGICKIDIKKGTVKNYFALPNTPNSLFNEYTSAFFEDANNNIWFSASVNKMYQYHPALDSFIIHTLQLPNSSLLTERVYIIGQQPNSHLLLASQKGILEFDYQNKKTTVVVYHSDMNTVKEAQIDNAGNYWMLTGSGLLFYNTSAKLFKSYTTQNGLPSNEDIDVIHVLKNGNVVLGGAGFISTFSPTELGSNKNIPPVYITNILANSKDTLYNTIQNKLSYLSGITFQFTALGFSTASQNMYMYRLIGIDTTWSKATAQRSVSYAQLPPGNYTFEVMGSNADGVWNTTPATFSFFINRPFYKTWWFYAIICGLILGAIFSIYKYKLKKAVELEKMRTRIATDLHDDIGATLSSIAMYSDSLKTQVKQTLPHLEPILTKMGENSREMVTNMSDIVWAINPNNDNGQKLLQRMENYATDMCAVKNMQLHFDISQNINNQLFTLEQRKNTYLFFKEAVNNAVKYSHANNLWVSITLQQKFELVIKDDGIGFDTKNGKEGNGLKNLQARANEIKGEYNLTSKENEGTTLQLKYNI